MMRAANEPNLSRIGSCSSLSSFRNPYSSSSSRRAGPCSSSFVEAKQSILVKAKQSKQQSQFIKHLRDILTLYYYRQAGGPYYVVKKGRKDNKSSPSPASLPNIIRVNLPRANATVTELIALFTAKGLTTTDLVALSGAHTIGFSHCDQFVSRLYSGSAIGAPAMNPRLLQALRLQCPHSGGNADVVAPLDVGTPFEFDNEYYAGIEKGMGVLATDQALGLDEKTGPIVREMAGDKGKFFTAFEAGMERLGGIRVKKGRKGEIRRYCGRHLT